MPDRKVRVDLALKPAQLADRLHRNPLAPRPPAPLIHHRRDPMVLDRTPDPAHMPRRDPHNVRRHQPTVPSVDPAESLP
jgi:hypothetical protein